MIEGRNRRRWTGRQAVRAGFRLALWLGVLSGCVILTSLAPGGSGAIRAPRLIPHQTADLFQFTNVLTLHLTFTPDQWAAMDPEGGRDVRAPATAREFDYVHADLEFNDNVFKDVAVRYKGHAAFRDSRGLSPRSLKIDLNRFAGTHRLAGMTQLNLHYNVADPSHMNEVLAHRLFRDAGVPAPRTAYARVHVTVPGVHARRLLGLYAMVEDVGATFAREHFETRRGAIFKPVAGHLFADLGDDWRNYRQAYDSKTRLAPEHQQRLIEFCQFVTRANDPEFAARLGEFVELDELARYVAVLGWLSSLDAHPGPGRNLHLHLHPKSLKFGFIPWNNDPAWGQFALRGAPAPLEDLGIRKAWLGQDRFLARVFKVESFQRLYLARLAEFSETIFRPERIRAQVDELAAAIRPSIREESAENLARFDQVVAGETVGPAAHAGGHPFGSASQLVKPVKPFANINL